MKFRCERDVLLDSLATAGRAVAKGLPGLSGIKANLDGDSLTLTGSDRDLTISVSVTVSGEGDGSAVIPARLASEIVKAVKPGAVEIAVEEESLRIRSGRSDFSIRLIVSDEFPKIESLESETVKISSESLTEALKQVVLAAS